MELSIFTVYGRNVSYTYRPAITRFTQDGHIGEQDSGFRFTFRFYGKRKDLDTGETIQGIRRPGLAQSSKMRANRASTELILSEGAAAMRENGYPEATEKDVLDFFMRKHGGKKGIDWNVYDIETGELVSDEAIEVWRVGEAEIIPSGPEKHFHRRDIDDSDFLIHDKEKKEWTCLACGVGPKKLGMVGHQRSNKHREQVIVKLSNLSSTAVGAA